MDVETASAIERLTERIDTLETSVHRDMTDLRGEVGELRGELGNLRAETREGLAEARRHANMLNEQTGEMLRLVAEGVAHLSVKIDSLRR